MSLDIIESQIYKNEQKLYLLKQDHEELKKAFGELKSLVEKLSERTNDHIRNDESWMFTKFGK